MIRDAAHTKDGRSVADLVGEVERSVHPQVVEQQPDIKVEVEQAGHGIAGKVGGQVVTVTVQPLAVSESVACRMLGLSLRSFQRLRAEGVIPEPVRLGSVGKPIWSVAVLQEWVAAGFRR